MKQQHIPQTHSRTQVLRMAAPILFSITLIGCASTAPDGTPYGQNPQDPFESYNRSMYKFNDAVDKAVLKPVATGYTKVVPQPARTGVSNFFSNLGDAWSFVNNVLQLKGEAAMNSFFRFAVNSTFGIGGLLDVATEMRLEKDKQDFGLTLAHYGVSSGPYLILPFLGPSTIRDTASLPVNWYGNLTSHVTPVSDRNALLGLSVVDARANLLQAGNLLQTASLDPYVMTRDIYLSIRNPSAQSDGSLDDEDYYEEGE